MNQPRNFAARAGRWSATHRKTAIFGWLAFVVAAIVLGGAVGTKTIDNSQSGDGESARADKTLAAAVPAHSDETVLVQSATRDATSPEFRAAVTEMQRRLAKQRHVRAVESPYAAGNDGQISPDGHSALIEFRIPGSDDAAQQHVGTVLDAVSAAQRANPGFKIAEFGDASANKQLDEVISHDFQRAELTSLPVTLLILLFAFGALVAAGVPLLLALTAVIATIGLLGPISHLGAVDPAIDSVILLIGLAVGVDYSMFYLRREREERAGGRGARASLEAAAATSGRAVIISGFTVMVAMAGMYLAGDPTFRSFATGTILVVAVAVAGSLTVLPALLSWLGDRVEKGRVPLINRLKRPRAGAGLWSRTVDRVLRRPAVSAALATAALGVLAIPAFSLHTAVPGVNTLPRDVPAVQTYDRIQAAFPGEQLPAQVVVSSDDVRSAPVQAAIRRLRRRASDSPLFKSPITVDVSRSGRVEEVSIPVAGDSTDSRSNAALAKLRDRLIPSTIGKASGATVAVTGQTASSMDFNDAMGSRLPLVFGFVLTAAFLLLLLTFRSIVIPIKAILLNLLSVGAAYGVLVWIFQMGHFESLLGFESNGSITSWMPLFLFVVLFGLSMDYHVFILTRIREAFDRGASTEVAVSGAIKSTAGVVTSAAVVMVAVFAIFATLSLLEMKQLGVGLAVAILLDATIVRGVLLPATMKLLGDWNWYLPKWLEWLPRGRASAAPGGGDDAAVPPSAEGALSGIMGE